MEADSVQNQMQTYLIDMPGVEPQCQCSDTGVVNDVDTGKAGCAQHFGRRFGYLCYVEGGEECVGAKKGRVGVFYRPCPAERKRDVARNKLLESMEGIDAELVSELLKNAKAAHVDEGILQDAKERIGTIGEMIEVREELVEALAGFDTKRLKELADQAEEFELYEFMDHDIPDRIEERIDFLESKDDREDDVKDAIKGIDLPKLQEAIEAAIAVQADDSVVQAGKKREAELISQRSQIKEDLLQAVDGWDVDRLKDLAEEAEDHKLYSELPHNLPSRIENRVEFLKSAGKKEAALRLAMEGVDPQELQETIDEVAKVRGNSQLLDSAKKRKQELLAELAEARQNLDAALRAFDVDELKSALSEAERLQIVTEEDEEIAEGRSKYLEVLADDSLGTLLRTIKKHESSGKYPDITARAHVRKKELRHNMHAQKMKVKMMIETGTDPDELQAELDEGLRIRAVGKDIKVLAEKKIAELRQR